MRGPHGAGKTHALGFLMRKVARGDVTPAPAVRQVRQLYGKVEEPAIEAVYRTLMSQISPTQLRDLAVRFVGELACDDVEATTGTKARRRRSAPGSASTRTSSTR